MIELKYRATFEGMWMRRAICTRVVDGDTIQVLLDQGMSDRREARIRLEGIDTPEMFGVAKDSDEYAKGLVAKEALEGLILDKEVVIETSKDRKSFDRYRARVFLLTGETEDDWVDIVAKMIELGHQK